MSNWITMSNTSLRLWFYTFFYIEIFDWKHFLHAKCFCLLFCGLNQQLQQISIANGILTCYQARNIRKPCNWRPTAWLKTLVIHAKAEKDLRLRNGRKKIEIMNSPYLIISNLLPVTAAHFDNHKAIRNFHAPWQISDVN